MTAFILAPPPDQAIAQELSGEPVFAFERLQDAPAVDALVDRAFGPGRYAKAAERLREGASLRRDLSICAWSGEELVGAVRQWTVTVGDIPAIFLGPIAVDMAERRQGLGAGLMRRAVQADEAAGERLVMLVGDMPFFAQFGFEVAPVGAVALPGPVDPARVLWRPIAPGGLDGVQGPVRPVRRS